LIATDGSNDLVQAGALLTQILPQIAGNVAELPAKDMNSMALGFFEARALYVALYLSIGSDKLAYARTAAYAWSIAIPIMGLWQAGKVFAAKDI
jgi:hypothetical protein